MSFGRRRRFPQRRNILQNEIQFSGRFEKPGEYLPSGLGYLSLYPYVALICSLTWLLKIRRRLRRILTYCLIVCLATSVSRTHPLSVRNEYAPNMLEQHIIYSSSVPSQSSSGLRHRKNRNVDATIWEAAKAGDVEETERQLQSGVDVNAYSEPHGTALSVAAYNGRLEVVELLMSRHAEVNGYYRGYREPALHAAAERGHKTIVQSLLMHGADVNAEVCGVSAIHVAAIKGHWGSVGTLLKFGADDNSREKVPMSIFHIASPSLLMDYVITHDTRFGNGHHENDEIEDMKMLVFERILEALLRRCLSSIQQQPTTWIGDCEKDAQGGHYCQLSYEHMTSSWAVDIKSLTSVVVYIADNVPNDAIVRYGGIVGEIFKDLWLCKNPKIYFNEKDIDRIDLFLRLMTQSY